jgi:hypothetical protein
MPSVWRNDRSAGRGAGTWPARQAGTCAPHAGPSVTVCGLSGMHDAGQHDRGELAEIHGTAGRLARQPPAWAGAFQVRSSAASFPDTE